MSSKRQRVEPTDQRGGGGEYANLKRDLHRSRKAKRDQTPDAGEIRPKPCAKQSGSTAFHKCVNKQHARHIKPRNGGRPTRSFSAHRRQPEMTVYQNPI